MGVTDHELKEKWHDGESKDKVMNYWEQRVILVLLDIYILTK